MDSPTVCVPSFFGAAEREKKRRGKLKLMARKWKCDRDEKNFFVFTPQEMVEKREIKFCKKERRTRT